MKRASFVIPTRNREPELAALLSSLRYQTVPLEIIVMDDGASDETKRLVEEQFPEVAYHRLGDGRGPNFQRNRGIALANCNIVFPLDDDTELPSPHTVEQTLADFKEPRIGAVGIPYINVRQDGKVRQCAPHGGGIFLLHAFLGASHAVRRDVFLSVGGYREYYFYTGEEGDLCIRMLQAGFITVAGRADSIHHLESPRRDIRRTDYYGARNSLLSIYHNVPAYAVPFHLVVTTWKLLGWTFVPNRFILRLRAVLAAYAMMLGRTLERRPVSPSTFRLFRRLKKREPVNLIEAEGDLALGRQSRDCISAGR